MARPKSLNPSHRHHKASNRGYVVLNGEYKYTGTWGTQAANDAYTQVLAEWIARGRQPEHVAAPTAATIGAAPTVKHLLAAFVLNAQAKYVNPDGTPAGEFDNFRHVMRPIKALYGDSDPNDFGPRKLKALRAHWVEAGHCRNYINRNTRRVIAIFRWAASEELLPAAIPAALETVSGLRRGEQKVRESAPVRPVPEQHVDAVLDHLPAPVRAMVELQAITGARQGELVQLRTCDVDRVGKKVWEYRPRQHKTAHHGHDRVILFGPRAQEILAPYLKPDVQAPCFSPADAEAARHARQREERETPLTPSQVRRGAEAKRRGRSRAPRPTYDSHSYRRAIARACEIAFGMPDSLRKPTPKPASDASALEAWTFTERMRRAAAGEWRRLHVWTPHRLRHNAATRFRRDHGMETTQVLLGHRLGSRITEVYAEQDHEKAREVMGVVG